MSRESRALRYPTEHELSPKELARVHSGYEVDDNGCWTWKKAKSSGGYGMVFVKHRYHQAHRLIYGWWARSVQPTSDIDHLCRNRACVNPEHLQEVTHAENIRRAYDPRFNPDADALRAKFLRAA